MLTITIQFTDIASAAAALAKLNDAQPAYPVVLTEADALADLKGTPRPDHPEVAAAPVEKPKKAKATAAATPAAPAPSQPTAEVVAAAAPEKTAAESVPAAEPAAPAPQASTVAEPFPYSRLQALVFKLLPDHGVALLEVSKRHGAAKFKELPATAWEAAYNDLIATYGG